MQIRLSFASESHFPRFPAGVGTWRAGYMTPIRLPWRHRARPSATLHEIPSLPRKANLSIILQRRMGFVNSFVNAGQEKFVPGACDQYTLCSRGEHGEAEKECFCLLERFVEKHL